MPAVEDKPPEIGFFGGLLYLSIQDLFNRLISVRIVFIPLDQRPHRLEA
tara:strand:- start:22 stop:168 length:147 start_codon:yes stop_codon:yes gene_type:complete